MADQRLFIPSGPLKLEAALRPGKADRAGVVAHPHSLFGGSMDNNVVLAAQAGLSQAGWTSLRFNFRGVGQSGGAFDQGEGEAEDLAAAIAFLKDRGAARLAVVGYSFGAWVAARAWPRLKDLNVLPLILIAPPAAFLSFEFLAPETRVGLIICGQNDDLAPPDLARDLGRRLHSPVEPLVLPGADHFFGGAEPDLTRLLSQYLSRD